MKQYNLWKPLVYGDRTVEKLLYPEELSISHYFKCNTSSMVQCDTMYQFISNCIKEPIPFVKALAMADVLMLLGKITENLDLTIKDHREKSEVNTSGNYTLYRPIGEITSLPCPALLRAHHYVNCEVGNISTGEQHLQFFVNCTKHSHQTLKNMSAIDMFVFYGVLTGSLEKNFEEAEMGVPESQLVGQN